MLNFLLLCLISIYFSLSQASEDAEELKESTSLIKPNTELEDLYLKMGFQHSNTYHPVPLEDTFIEIEAPYPEINNLLPDIWQLVMLHLTPNEIITLSSTCRSTFKAYIKLPLYKIVRDKQVIINGFQLLRQKYKPLETPEGDKYFVLPTTSQSFAHELSLLCQQESVLKSVIEKREDINEKAFLDALNEQDIPIDSIQKVLEDSINNYPFLSTPEQDSDITYLAQYSQYPHAITKKRSFLKNIPLQLGAFFVLLTPQIYGLYRYIDLLPPTGSILETMTKLKNFIVWGVGDTLNRRYPYVPLRCIGNYKPSGFWSYNPDYTLTWYNTSSPYCAIEGQGSVYGHLEDGNLAKCLSSVKIAALNTTFWAQYLTHPVYSYPCSLNLNNQFDNPSITCGQIEIYNKKEIRFNFNIADMNCANGYWATSYAFLAIAGVIGSAAFFWAMIEGHHTKTGISGCAAGLMYVATLIALYVMPITYGS